MITSDTIEGLAEELRSQLRGGVTAQGDDAYETARKVYNGMIDRRPALIAACADVADVMASVRFAREHQLPLAVRGGGHSGPGLGTCDAGLVIDLSRMRGIRVDPATASVRVDGGCVWGDVDHATHGFGLAVPSGFISSTGVGGLSLGGGIGYLARRYGLTIDSLLGADVVLADGTFVSASANEHADLVWAIRGGGGNFGAVTSFLFKAHPVDVVYGGPIFWDLKYAADVLPKWRDFILQAPEDINGWFAFVTVPPGPPYPAEHHLKKMCATVWCYTGALDGGEAALRPVRKFAPPVMDFAGPIPFPVLQSMFDPVYPPGLQWYWKADFLRDLPDAAIELHLKYGERLPSMHSTMHLYPINGAAQRVARDETAFSFRDANFAEVIVGVDPDPANNTRIIEWAKDYWQALHRFSAGGAYVNMVMDEGSDYVKSAYRDNYPRLTKIKAEYDPGNLFHVNQNIEPARHHPLQS
ncbi:MAG: FAD-binding oxidoreductase [Candidatus Cybelea sp.]